MFHARRGLVPVPVGDLERAVRVSATLEVSAFFVGHP